MPDKNFTITEAGIMQDAMLAAHYSDRATELQVHMGRILGDSILLTPVPSDTVRDIQTGVHIMASTLDLADGWLKNFAVKMASKVLFKQERDIRKNKPSKQEWELLAGYNIVDEPRKDEKGDKDYFHSTLGPLAVREFLLGHQKTAAVLKANQEVSRARDHFKTRDRDFAEQHRLETNAKSLGKGKTFFHRLGTGIIMSRAGKSPIGRFAGASIITAGTSLGLYDYYKYRRYIQHEKHRMGI